MLNQSNGRTCAADLAVFTARGIIYTGRIDTRLDNLWRLLMAEAIDQTIVPNPQLDWAQAPLPTDAKTVALDDINMADARYFQTDTQFAFFKRLRDEDPVHLNTHPFTGDFWSITKRL